MNKYLYYFFIFLSASAIAFNCENSKTYEELASKFTSCSKKVHLTYDDGPDANVTPTIIKELSKRNVSATFFVSTKNLKPNEKNQVLIDMIENGHNVASHGHHHYAHDLRLLRTTEGFICDPNMLSPEESEAEIAKSWKLIEDATEGKSITQKNKIFRFPYGRGASPSKFEMSAMSLANSNKEICEDKELLKNLKEDPSYAENLKEYRNFRSEALKRVHASNSDHLGWNYDSSDSNSYISQKASEDPNWYLNKVIGDLCTNPANSISALFHDFNKKFNATIAGDLIDIGRCLGIEFVSYEKLMEQKQFLIDKGVLQPKPELRDFLMNNNSEINEVVQIEITNSCQLVNDEKKTCQSSNGNEYSQCEGIDYICYNGSWFAKSHKTIRKNCSTKTCISQYSSRIFKQCEGSDSICLDGVWKSKNDPAVQDICFN